MQQNIEEVNSAGVVKVVAGKLKVGDRIEYVGGHYGSKLKRGKILRGHNDEATVLVLEDDDLFIKYVREVEFSDILRIIPPPNYRKIALWILTIGMALLTIYLLSNL